MSFFFPVKNLDPKQKERKMKGEKKLLPVPGTVGTPHASAALLAAVFSPIASMFSGRGPTKAIPSCSHRRANIALSERKPYPGWMTSTPWALALAMIPSTSR